MIVFGGFLTKIGHNRIPTDTPVAVTLMESLDLIN
jgi:hypothetical protein